MLVWHRGHIIPADSLRVEVADSVFEHGLGLFETLRASQGRPLWLGRHLERMARSAQVLGLPPLTVNDLPDERSIQDLLQADSRTNALVRITRTGGGAVAPTLWVRTGPLPLDIPKLGATIIEAPFRVDCDDPLARHKTLNYWARRIAYDRAVEQGGHEALIFDRRDRPCEGSRTNLFVVNGDTVVTPPLTDPIVPGLMRRAVIESAVEIGLRVVEASLSQDDLRNCSEIFLTNSVRGIIPVVRLMGTVDRRLSGDFPTVALLRQTLTDASFEEPERSQL